jgi:hypothetical protein
MNLAPLAKQILMENEIKVDDMSQEVKLSERSYEFLKIKIDQLNKKASKWHVPPLTLKVNRMEEVDVKKSGIFGDIATFKKKFYYVTVSGDSPHVEGYTFIGKVQHTPGGENILNIAPSSPIKNLPEIYRTAKGVCDVCKQNRERFNTFVLRMDKEDPERFPDKKVGDLIQIGSACLKRFLPGISVDTLINYAQMIEVVRIAMGSGEDEPEDSNDYEGPGSPNPFRGHLNTETLMMYIALVYSARGEYVPKSKASYDRAATSEEAIDVLFDRDRKTHVSKMLDKNPVLASQSKVLAGKVVDWMKKQDFNEMGKNKPDMANYFGNLNVIAHSPSVNIKNVGYMGGILQSYLYYERTKAQTDAGSGKKYVGQVGQRIVFNGLVKDQKAFPSQFTGGTVTLYKFEDLDGNNIHWWANKNLNLQTGQRYSLSGLVKKQEVDKWTKQPTTVIKNAKLEKD